VSTVIYLDDTGHLPEARRYGTGWWIELDPAGLDPAVAVQSVAQADALIKAARKIRRELLADACAQAAARRAAVNEAAAAAERERDPGSPVPDSEVWLCEGPCHGTFIGNRPAGDVCGSCAALALAIAPAADPVIPAITEPACDVAGPDGRGVRTIAGRVTGEEASAAAAGHDDALITPHPGRVSRPDPVVSLAGRARLLEVAAVAGRLAAREEEWVPCSG
jgi:hypothetical protein